MESGTATRLELRFAGQLVEQLGAQLYPKVTATVAELISNAWDADAHNVWVKIPFEEDWRDQAVIEVLDDGHGMTRKQAQDKYLVVGRNRRRFDGPKSEGGRRLHGRKGIGKLAAFGTAGWLECVTLRDDQLTAFAIDYDDVRTRDPDKPYETELVSDPDPLRHPDTGEELEHGTRIRLTKLRARRRTSESVFQRSMARRFALDSTEMTVFINGEPLTRFDYEVEIRFPRDGVPPGAPVTVEDGWAVERIDVSPMLALRRERQLASDTTTGPDSQGHVDADATSDATSSAAEDAAEQEAGGDHDAPSSSDATNDGNGDEADEPGDDTREVRWWIGFTAIPIPEEDVRGISILSRGKLAQRPFMFESASGTTGQLGQEYLVGEVQADWLDYGKDADEDLIQSNRDQLQLDNAELEPLLKWGRERLKWALAQRNKLRRERRAGPEALGRPVEEVIQRAPSRSRERLRTLAARIAEFTEGGDAEVARAVDAVLEASEATATSRAGEALRLEADPDAATTWTTLAEAAGAACVPVAELLRARAYALEQFELAIVEPPVRRLHREVPSSAWLISPLLDHVPRQVDQDDDDLTVVSFEAVPPLTEPLTCRFWMVGATPDPGTIDGAGNGHRVLSVATSGPESEGWLTWAELLGFSRAAHERLLAELESR
jgi:hypothetical protein